MKQLQQGLSDSELDRRLAAARPKDHDVSVGAVSQAVAVARAEAQRRAPKRRMLWGAVVGAVCFGAIGVTPAGAAGIQWIATQVGWAPAAGGEIIADSEWVDLSAPDLVGYLHSIFPSSLPLAQQASRVAIVEQVAFESRRIGGVQQGIGLQARMEQLVLDGWLVEWSDARSDGDLARVAAAETVIRTAPTWPAVASTSEARLRALLESLVDRIDEGDDQAAQALAQVLALPSWDGADRDPFELTAPSRDSR